MNRAEGGQSRGYTIVETLIFLAVSGAMFISAMTLINGRQAKTEFSTAVRDFESSLNDTASDVATGYYSNIASVTGRSIVCTPSVVGVQIRESTGSDQQGANAGCIFVGKAIQFGPSDTDNASYNVFSLAGLQYKNNNPDVSGISQNINDALTRPIAKSSSSDLTPDAIQKMRIANGAKVNCVLYGYNEGLAPATATPCTDDDFLSTDLLAFVTTFQPADYTQSHSGSSSQVDLFVPQSSSKVGRLTSDAASSLAGLRTTSWNMNPGAGIFICLQSGGTDQYSLIKLGGNSSRFSTSATIKDGKCGNVL